MILLVFLEDDVKTSYSRISGPHTLLGENTLGSTADLTYMSTALASRIAWSVSENYTHSEHQAICTELKDESSLKKSFRKIAGVCPTRRAKLLRGHVFHGGQTHHISGWYDQSKSHRNHSLGDESMRCYHVQEATVLQQRNHKFANCMFLAEEEEREV